MFSADDHQLMAHALRLAEKGLYTTMPNPRVGCVIARNGQVVAEGWHERAGLPHAEILALKAAGTLTKDARVYLTLEPCAHQGRTPPCCYALESAGIGCVIVAVTDPNPKVSGRGIHILRQSGICVEVGLMEHQAQVLNKGFFSRMQRQRPWVTLKTASSLDGRIALQNGESQWITSSDARADVQQLRARSCAILTGVGTIVADNPRLTVRDTDIGRQPLRVIVDSHLRIPTTARVLDTDPVLVACLSGNPAEKLEQLQNQGVQILELPGTSYGVDLVRLLSELAKLEVNEVLVEAGATLAGALLQQKLVDELVCYIAPVVLGSDALGMFNIVPLTSMQQRVDIDVLSLDYIGRDIRLRARPH